MTNPKIQIAVPCLGLISPETAKSIMEAQAYLRTQNIDVSFNFHANDAMISRARCFIAHDFLRRSDADYLMMIDADIVFPDTAISVLLHHKKMVIGGNYKHRSVGNRWASHEVETNYNSLVHSDYLATGFMLVHRDALTTLIDRYKSLDLRSFTFMGEMVWGFFIPYVKDNIYLSEDYAFTQLLLKAGIEVWVDRKIHLGHCGSTVYQ